MATKIADTEFNDGASLATGDKAKIGGCKPCNTDLTTLSRYTSCKITTSSTNTVWTVSVVVCAAGNYRSSDTICSPCSTTTLLNSAGTALVN